MVDISAIVLAAGLSRRMGDHNKLFLDYKGSPIIRHVLNELSRCDCQEIILVVSELSIEGLTDFENDKVKIVENKKYKTGMTSSIQAGVSASYANTHGYMVCLGDQPTIRKATYDTIINAFKSNYPSNHRTITVPYFEGAKGNPVIFSTAYREEILDHEAPEGCKGIIMDHKQEISRIEVHDPAILRDIDTRSDYEDLITGVE